MVGLKLLLSRYLSVARKWPPPFLMSEYRVNIPKGVAVSFSDENRKEAELTSKFGVAAPQGVAISTDNENGKASQDASPKVATLNSIGMRAVVKSLSTTRHMVLYLAWGPTHLVELLLSEPLGASETVLEVLVSNSKMSLIDLIGKVPFKFCSKDTAADLAMLAYNRFSSMSRKVSPSVAVGFISPWTNTQLLGDYRFHFSIMTDHVFGIYSVSLTKGLRTREEEDNVISRVLLKEIAIACGVAATFDVGLTESEALVKREMPTSDAFRRRSYLSSML